MKYYLSILFSFLIYAACAQTDSTPTLRSILLEQLRTTHNEKTWKATIQTLDSVLTAFEIAVKTADETKLRTWYSTIAHVGTHNAYHTGQIIYIRKMKGWWDDDNGVK